ncbi:MAG: hypothetical protein J5772_04915 [Clostridia bacterium]|nr:hypothetical protein [Clostridia bacterium]
MSTKEIAKKITRALMVQWSRREFKIKMRKRSLYHIKKWKTNFVNLDERSILSDSQKRAVQEYWKSKFPVPSTFTYQYHAFYTAATGHFDVHYIPDNLYYCLIDIRLNNRQRAKAIDNKCLYAKVFPQAKQPEIIAYRMEQNWVDKDYCSLSEKELSELLDAEEELVLKIANESMGGKGVFFISGSDKSNQVFDLIKQNNKDVVIQKVLKQHPELAKLNPDSVNTIRHLTFIENGKAKVYSSILRMGIDNSRVDNASSGGITCGITSSGQLKPVAYAVTGKKYDLHPSSGIAFDSITVPSFEESIRFVERLHESFPLFRLISWDIAIDENGEPLLIEPNLYVGELDFHQLNNGPLFGTDQERILTEIAWNIPEEFTLRYGY